MDVLSPVPAPVACLAVNDAWKIEIAPQWTLAVLQKCRQHLQLPAWSVTTLWDFMLRIYQHITLVAGSS